MQEKLIEYARLIVKMGIRPQVGQQVIIVAGLDQIEFVRYVTELCYQEGASKVRVEWQDMPLAKLDQLYQSEEMLSRVEDWELAKL
jgi:aminopeptidase